MYALEIVEIAPNNNSDKVCDRLVNFVADIPIKETHVIRVQKHDECQFSFSCLTGAGGSACKLCLALIIRLQSAKANQLMQLKVFSKYLSCQKTYIYTLNANCHPSLTGDSSAHMFCLV